MRYLLALLTLVCGALYAHPPSISSLKSEIVSDLENLVEQMETLGRQPKSQPTAENVLFGIDTLRQFSEKYSSVQLNNPINQEALYTFCICYAQVLLLFPDQVQQALMAWLKGDASNAKAIAALQSLATDSSIYGVVTQAIENQSVDMKDVAIAP